MLLFNLEMYLGFPLLLLILLQFINFIMIITVGVTLMKTPCSFKPWPQGKLFTRARVKVECTPSILTRPLSFYFLINCAILFSSLLLVGIYGIADLAIPTLKFLSFRYKIMDCLSIIMLILSILVFTVFLAKCTDFHFLVQDL